MKTTMAEFICYLVLIGMIFILAMFVTDCSAGELTVAGNATQDEVNSHSYMVRIEGDVGAWDYQAERSYAQTGEIITSDKWLAAVGFDYMPGDVDPHPMNFGTLGLGMDARYQENIQPDRESLIGGGPKWYFIWNDLWQASVSTYFMHRWTEHDDKENTSTVLSTRGKVKYVRGDLSAKLLLSHIEDLEGAGYVSTARLSASYELDKGMNVGAMVEGEQRPECTVTKQMVTAGVTW